MTTAEALRKYNQAVLALVKVAQADHGASRVAAQVLLNLYNGYEFLTDLTDLGILDTDLLRHAMTAIQVRVVCRVEPQTVIQNGDDIFQRLAKDWWHLSRYERDRKLIEGAAR